MDAPVFFFVKEAAKAGGNGQKCLAFSAALQYDYNINYLTLTPEQAEPFYKRNRSA